MPGILIFELPFELFSWDPERKCTEGVKEFSNPVRKSDLTPLFLLPYFTRN
jgi:hypothetical protein